MKKTDVKRFAYAGAVLAVFVAIGATSTWAYAGKRAPVEFFPGHSHDSEGVTVGAPEHSGGTDRYGCHNGSVPYHCH